MKSKFISSVGLISVSVSVSVCLSLSVNANRIQSDGMAITADGQTLETVICE